MIWHMGHSRSSIRSQDIDLSDILTYLSLLRYTYLYFDYFQAYIGPYVIARQIFVLFHSRTKALYLRLFVSFPAQFHIILTKQKSMPSIPRILILLLLCSAVCNALPAKKTTRRKVSVTTDTSKFVSYSCHIGYKMRIYLNLGGFE